MYDIDGDFGRVRSVKFPTGPHAELAAGLSFTFNNAGWHRCNDLYIWNRSSGKPGHLFLFSLSEGGMLSLDGKPPVRLPAHSVTHIPPHRAHSYFTHPGEVWEFYWLDANDQPGLPLDELSGGQAVRPVSNMEQIGREIESLLRARTQSELFLRVEGSRVVSSVYHTLLQDELLQEESGKQDELVRRIVQEMEKDCGRAWNLAETAGRHFISVPQLIRRFKAETGQTPYAYLMALRLQTAEMYLKYTGRTVEEIGWQTGFAGTSNFILQFKKRYGVTPAQYRGQT